RGLMATPRMPLPEPALLRAELDVMELELEQAGADLREQRAHVEDMTVRSPIGGVVDKTFVEPGEYVAAGQPILMMHAPEDVWIEANIKETAVRELAVGQPVDIHVDAYPDTAYRGRVAVIGGAATSEFALLPTPNPSGNFTKITQRIPVKILIEDGPKAALKPGMMVVVDIDVRHRGG
ncbi:HlyD family secretion protein, partial [Ectothiorhodospiraceae bacterium WFHF3C12]|nr:HlyD family secretion protein [Ectothiorhodospiraceae bacterium WFHF3C12]